MGQPNLQIGSTPKNILIKHAAEVTVPHPCNKLQSHLGFHNRTNDGSAENWTRSNDGEDAHQLARQP
jgi:hypothetical protein